MAVRLFYRDRQLSQVNAVRASADQLLALAGAAVTHHITTSEDASAVHHIEAGAGPTLVLLHGGSGGGANWFRLVGPLARRFRVLAPDLPGFGESTAVPGRFPLGEQTAAFVGSWLERIAPAPWILVGTSLGGLAAFRLAQAQPARVSALVLVDSVGLGRAVSLPVRLAAFPPLTRYLVRPSRAGTRVLFDRLLTGGRAPIPPHLRDALLEYLWQCDVAGASALVAASLRLFTGPRGQREVITSEELQAFRRPSLIVWGARDRFVPVAHGHRAAALIPGAGIRVIAAAGHSPNWETPDQLLSVVDGFLEASLR